MPAGGPETHILAVEAMLPRTRKQRNSERTRERASIAAVVMDGQMAIHRRQNNCYDAAIGARPRRPGRG